MGGSTFLCQQITADISHQVRFLPRGTSFSRYVYFVVRDSLLSYLVTLRYTFNSSNNKYKGSGAGTEAQNRM